MRHFYTKAGGLTVWEHTQSGEVEVARIIGTHRPDTVRRSEARLFAAAPDLLHALRCIAQVQPLEHATATDLSLAIGEMHRIAQHHIKHLDSFK